LPSPHDGSPRAEPAIRVLVLAPQPFYQDRGTPIALRHVLEALSRLEIEADVLTFPVGTDVDIPGIRLQRVRNLFGIRHVPIGLSIQKVILDVQLAFELWRLLQRNASEYTCIHALEESAFLAVLLGQRAGVPVIYDMQSSLPEQLKLRRGLRSSAVQRFLRLCERWLLNRAEVVVCSAGLAAYVRRVAPAARVREWWFPVQFDQHTKQEVAALRQTLRIQPKTPVIVYSGTFEPYQGLSQLIHAIPRVRTEVPNAVFVMVGRHGAFGDAVAREAQQLGLLEDGVHLVPRQPRDRVAAYLALADVLVSPRCEGGNLPLKIFDYLAAGKPIVATDLPVHHPTLDSTRAEMVQSTPDDIARGIVTMLKDRPHAVSLARAAQAYARSNLDQEVFVRWIGALYTEVASYRRNQVRA
jgi:glycosyltransferase involved in cell wall biosynthesis